MPLLLRQIGLRMSYEREKEMGKAKGKVKGREGKERKGRGRTDET